MYSCIICIFMYNIASYIVAYHLLFYPMIGPTKRMTDQISRKLRKSNRIYTFTNYFHYSTRWISWSLYLNFSTFTLIPCNCFFFFDFLANCSCSFTLVGRCSSSFFTGASAFFTAAKFPRYITNGIQRK